MHVERLKHLISILERVEAESAYFDMNRWGDYNVELDCMTACCAMGHACFDEEFKKQGLKAECIGGIFYPTFGKIKDFKSCESFFHLNEDQADYIFIEKLAGEKPSDVIKRIHQVLNGKI